MDVLPVGFALATHLWMSFLVPVLCDRMVEVKVSEIQGLALFLLGFRPNFTCRHFVWSIDKTMRWTMTHNHLVP